MNQTLENQTPIRTAENFFARTFWMWHQADDVAGFVANAGDIIEGAVRVGSFGWLALVVYITPKNLVVRLQLRQRLFVGEITTLAVRDGDAQKFAGWNLIREWRVRCLGAYENVFAAELQGAIANQCAGEQT